MAFLRLQNIVKRYGDLPVLRDVSLEAEKGEFVVFVGPSGCGKSTLLRIIAGLEETTDGQVFIDGADVTDVEPARREVSMVFQSYALFPHMSVRNNIAFGLKMSGMPKPQIEEAVAEAARILQIEPLLDRKPRQLSGGQRQRVAIGRAIVRQPKLFLFDEPLSNLDAELRAQMRIEIARLHRSLGVTMIFVTHDQVEAMTLADRIVVLRAGRIEQVGTPSELYARPANMFVAGFIGSPRMNFLDVEVVGSSQGAVTLVHPAFPDGPVSFPISRPAPMAGERVSLGLRPEQLNLEGRGRASLAATFDIAENLGGTSHVYAQIAGGETINIAIPGQPRATPGERLLASFDPQDAYLFDRDAQAL
ncbi:MAG: sn-glycerol-3-phosphate ABC transporter ATP-binding protein UgpC [Rhizobiales bacterium]|nr:sn-glycerol-3-phosphate ABC transporter ATP-binding protein UgpC [Hyphomicrobiales bacterium]